MYWLDLVRIVGAGVVLGVIMGRIIVRRPYHLERLHPRTWLPLVKRMGPRRWLVLLAISLSIAFLSLVFSMATGSILQHSGIETVSPEEYPFVSIERNYPWLTLLLVNILPIFEEWIFRGVIMDELIRWRRSKLLAVLTSALLFSAFHLSNPGTYPAIVISMLPASLLLSVCYLYTGLGGVILAHNSYNTILVVIGILAG
ncbi:MAG: CPBP family intramembrane glutamic endopeptidase [Candidatus Hadarchaeum sp.]|uniref:CPBP family intramembrane glutamic endopeptidase n=1 Tax=Candidatus Hadarchaeum sp. TaxID=2883567 RepID=UPI0031716501